MWAIKLLIRMDAGCNITKKLNNPFVDSGKFCFPSTISLLVIEPIVFDRLKENENKTVQTVTHFESKTRTENDTNCGKKIFYIP